MKPRETLREHRGREVHMAGQKRPSDSQALPNVLHNSISFVPSAQTTLLTCPQGLTLWAQWFSSRFPET